jgi:uncharacterized protein YjdB
MKKIVSFLIVLLGVLFINTKLVFASLTFRDSSVKIGVDYVLDLTVNGGSGNLSWASSNESVVTVSNGTIRGVSTGSAYISVTDGTYSAMCSVNVIDNYVAVSGISLPQSSMSLSIGEQKRINATVNPSSASNNTITYVSDNNNVATVDSSGNVKGVGAGSAHISLTAENKVVIVTIAVVDNVPLKGITAPADLSLTEGEKSKIVVNFNPTNASNKGVSFKSSNTAVATVDSSGTVNAVSAGEATITIISTEGSYVATTKVKVAALDKSLKGISLDKTTVSLKPEETVTLTVKFNPDNAENKKVKWSSSDKKIATVEEGVVTALKPGIVEIKVTSDEGNFSDTCKVTISSLPIESIAFEKSLYEVYVGATLALTTIATPENSFIEDAIWESDNPQVATVSDGVVTGVGEGTAVITVSNAAGDITASTTVNVKRKNEPLLITITGYDLNFSPEVINYTLLIGNETSLDIRTNRDAKYVVIGGNRDLKNGSIITVTVNEGNKVTYVINIKKKGSSAIYFIAIISVLMLINIIRILVKNKKR